MNTCSQTRIDGQMIPEPAALERLARVIRIRGFTIDTITFEQRADRFCFTMEVHGNRAPEMLARQLEKLETVMAVTLGATRPHSAGAEHECESIAS